MSGTIAFAFRRRYSLPPNDPRFLDLTPAEVAIDYWAHRHADDPKLRHEMTTDDYDEEVERMIAEAERKEAERAAAAAASAPDSEFDTLADDSFGAAT